MKTLIDSVSLHDVKSNVERYKDELSGIDLSLFDEAKSRLKETLETGMPIFRSVSIPHMLNPLEELLKRTEIGTSWTYCSQMVHIMRNPYRTYGDTYIYESVLIPEAIDWVFTAALHMIPIRGTYEREIRMKGDFVIPITNILTDIKENLLKSDEKYYFLTKKLNK